jgi:outer membrane receptor protein involved in Fe transport
MYQGTLGDRQRKTLFAIIFLIAGCSVYAQPAIRGTVLGQAKKPLAAANVLLLKPTDSTLVKGTITNDAGQFSLDKITPGNYNLVISFTGFEDINKPGLLVESALIDLGSLQLNESGVQLEKVTVTSRKPLFEQKVDRMVVNVRNSITAAGSTALDVLERSPGILVDRQNGTISMNGKDGVSVMINGKMTRMPMSALVQMLQGMNASNIEKIELITTPPANFDAEGNAGFINIVMLSNPNQGLNGSYSLTMGYGRGEVPAASVSFNYRKKKLNLYGDYSFSLLHTEQLFTNYRKVLYQGDVTENYVESNRDTYQRNHDASIGFDYELSKKTVGGVLFSAYNNKWSMDAENQYSKLVNGLPDTSTFIINDEINHWKNYMADINLQHKFKEGESISFDLNYLWYHDNNPTNYTNKYYNGQGDYLYTELTKSGKVTPIYFWVGAIDYNTRLSRKWSMQSGLKYTLSRFTNDVAVETYKQNAWMEDPSLTAKYKLKENIGAAYASFDGELNKKSSVKLGLRYEYTTSNLGTATTKNIVDRRYGRLFPSFFISHKLDDNNSLNFSYSRRINRPTFNDMAPFVIFMDPNTFFSGNSALQPSITDGVKTDYLYKNFVFSLSYSIETASIARFQVDVDLATNKQYMRAQNLDKTRMLNASISLPLTITKWWSLQSNIMGTYQRVNAFYKNEPKDISMGMASISAAQTFKLPKDYVLELTGFYRSAGLSGIAQIQGLGRVDIGAQKKLGKRGGSLRFNVTDLFQTLYLSIHDDLPEQGFSYKASIRFAYRTFRLTWTCPFGKRDLKNKRDRATGAEDEKNRVTQ